MSNQYIPMGDHTILRITRSNGSIYDFLLDNEDVSAVRKFGSWSILTKKDRPWYIYAKSKGQLLHRLVMGNPECLVDHRNRNTLDTRKNNLREADVHLNAQNRGLRHGTNKLAGRSSGEHPGVYWDTQKSRWRVRLTEGGKRRYYGYFSDPVEAGRVANMNILRIYGSQAVSRTAICLR